MKFCISRKLAVLLEQYAELVKSAWIITTSFKSLTPEQKKRAEFARETLDDQFASLMKRIRVETRNAESRVAPLGDPMIVTGSNVQFDLLNKQFGVVYASSQKNSKGKRILLVFYPGV